MENTSNLLNWYKELVEREKVSDLHHTVWKVQEGIYDCIKITFNSENPLTVEILRHHPIYILFHKPLINAMKNPDYELSIGREETGEFDSIYTYNDNGFGEGLLLDKKHYTRLFNKACSLTKDNLLKEESINKPSIKPVKSKEKFLIDKFLKKELDSSIYKRYHAVLNQPKLANVNCFVAVNGLKDCILKEGTLADCLVVALQETNRTNQRHEVWLPIGDTTYIFATFEAAGEHLPLKQTSFLPIRIIESAFLTYKELDEYEQDLMEHDLFIESDILNSIRILSEKTIYERLDNREELSLFEDIASDLFSAGSAKEALNDLLFNLGCDFNTHRNKLRLKGLMHFATQEK